MAESKFLDKIQKVRLMRELFPDRLVRGIVSEVDRAKYDRMHYRVSYKLLDKDRKVIANYPGNNCFAGLAGHVRKCIDNVQFVRYRPEVHPETTEDDYRRWYKLGREIGLYGAEQDEDEVFKQGITIDLKDEKTLVPRLYMQLCWMRWLREGPGIVKHTLKLVHEAGRDVWASVAYAHKHHCFYVDQSLFPFNASPYSVANHPSKADRNLALVLHIQRLCLTPEQTDKRHYLTQVKKKNDYHWKWQGWAIVPPVNWFLKRREMLLADDLFPVLVSGSFKQAEKLVNQIKRESNCVEFVRQ